MENRFLSKAKGQTSKIWYYGMLTFYSKYTCYIKDDRDTKKRLGKVFYSDFRTTFAIGMGKNGSKSLNDDLWKYVQNGNRVEVIGNIFDNPELLRVQP